MIPLDLVRLYVHNLPGRCLKLRLLTGRYYYLELNAPDREMAFLFDRWIRLINLLQEPTTYWAPRTLKTPLSDLAHVAPPASTWHLQDQPRRRRSAVTAALPKKPTSPKQKKAKASKRPFKSQAVGDSVPLIWSQLEPPSARKKASEKNTDVSLLVSYKHLYMREALGDLADPDSSTLSSSPATREHPQKVPAELAPSREAPAGPAAPKKTPALASAPRKAPAGRVPWKTPRFAAIHRKAASRPVPCREPGSLSSPSPQALTPGTCYRMACDSAHLGAGPAGSRAGMVLESSRPGGKTEPLVLVGTQGTQVMEVRAQKMSLELPGHRARREMEEVVVGRACEVALDGLKGRAQVEDRLRSSKEERLVDLPGFRSQATGQRRKWVKTQQLAVEGAPGAPRRPFSVEDLTLARMAIVAKAKEPPLRPRLFGLPSWLWFSQVLARSPKMDRDSQTPIPLPATRWEDVPSPTVPSPISKMEARVSQKLHRGAAEAEGGSSLESLVPTLLDLEKRRNTASAMEQTKTRRAVFTPWPSPSSDDEGRRRAGMKGGLSDLWGRSKPARPRPQAAAASSPGATLAHQLPPPNRHTFLSPEPAIPVLSSFSSYLDRLPDSARLSPQAPHLRSTRR
ncbi:PREDICTED: protein FAM71E2 [Myotis brandtii]|uniref:protein FAM71E2 n=1 Tax=Myotis brandtii TaxID=109478 RepID=UPI0003BBE7FB|nr:PREDICTED: protein FAM71E2 [Myotis brandtii]